MRRPMLFRWSPKRLKKLKNMMPTWNYDYVAMPAPRILKRIPRKMSLIAAAVVQMKLHKILMPNGEHLALNA